MKRRAAQQGVAGVGVVVAMLLLVLVCAIGVMVVRGHHPTSSNEKSNVQTDSATSAILSGVVSQGPTAPTCTDNMPCYSPVADRTLEALDANGSVAATTKTDSAGKYSLRLKPGHYTIKLTPPMGSSALNGNEVNLTSGSHELNLTVDSGIR